MNTTNRDPLWISFPRWLVCSGIPQWMSQNNSPLSWLILRNLIELDCDTNLTPDWFPYSLGNLSIASGISQNEIRAQIDYLSLNHWIEHAPLDETHGKCKILTPIHIPLEEHELYRRLSEKGIDSGKFVLRYKEDPTTLNKVEKVVYLYQMMFGARFTPRIAEDLESIANEYDMSMIYNAFSEAHLKKAKSLSWIKSNLRKSTNSELLFLNPDKVQNPDKSIDK